MSKKGKIRFWDLVFINVAALYGIRWIAKSTASSFGLGLGAIPIWLIFSLIFFVPQALIAAEFAAKYTNDGGIYDWVKRSFGEKWGFLVSWLNWTSKIFWFSSILTFLSINVAYILGFKSLTENKMFVLVLSLFTFWVLTLLSTKGVAKAKILTSLGAFGSTVPTIFLIGMAFFSIFIFKTVSPASTYNLQTLTPLLNADSLVAISTLMFGLSGAEIAANFINEMDNPKKDYPKAIMVSAGIVSVMYIVGSVAMTMILPPEKITASTGIFDALLVASANLGISSWLTKVLAVGIAFSIFAGLFITIIQPAKMLFSIVPKGVFPRFLTKTNSVNIPTNAIYFQAGIVSILLISTTLLPSVDSIYNVLVAMCSLSSLIPYLMMYASYIKMRKSKKLDLSTYVMVKNNKVAIGIGVFLSVLSAVALILTATPVMSTVFQNIIYEIEMVGGTIIIILSGVLIWRRYTNNIEKEG